MFFRKLISAFPHLRKIQRQGGWSEKGRDKRTKVNGVFREFSIPFIVSVRPFVAATSYGEKAGADPRTEERLPTNFSKARATAVAIIPNEKVTAAPPGTAVQADRCCLLYFTSGSRRNLFSRYHGHTPRQHYPRDS